MNKVKTCNLIPRKTQTRLVFEIKLNKQSSTFNKSRSKACYPCAYMMHQHYTSTPIYMCAH